MAEEGVLDKTNRMNLLLDFYEPLLTDKQRTFLKQYFHEDFTLGEIAESYEISRQAVFEHIKRGEAVLEEYESKLGLLRKHERRCVLLAEIENLLAAAAGADRERFNELMHALKSMD